MTKFTLLCQPNAIVNLAWSHTASFMILNSITDRLEAAEQAIGHQQRLWMCSLSGMCKFWRQLDICIDQLVCWLVFRRERGSHSEGMR